MCRSSPESLKNDTNIAIKVLKTLLACKPQVYIILDGVDEIDEVERSKLVQCLIDLQKECDQVKILISSRPEADLKKLLSEVSTSIRVDDHNAGSIQVFVEQWVRNWFKTNKFLPDARCALERWLAPLSWKSKGKPPVLYYHKIALLLNNYAIGMFLYATVVLNSIEFLDDLGEIENEIGVLPETLDDA